MHLLAEKSVRIQRPKSAVFEYVTNMENFKEWFPGVISIESSNPLSHGQRGKEYLEAVSVPLRGIRKIKLTVREVQGHRFFATEGRFPPLMPRMEISLNDIEINSCELTWRMFSRSNNLIVKCTLLPLAKRVMEKRAALGVKALKIRLEGNVP